MLRNTAHQLGGQRRPVDRLSGVAQLRVERRRRWRSRHRRRCSLLSRRPMVGARFERLSMNCRARRSSVRRTIISTPSAAARYLASSTISNYTSAGGEADRGAFGLASWLQRSWREPQTSGEFTRGVARTRGDSLTKGSQFDSMLSYDVVEWGKPLEKRERADAGADRHRGARQAQVLRCLSQRRAYPRRLFRSRRRQTLADERARHGAAGDFGA